MEYLHYTSIAFASLLILKTTLHYSTMAARLFNHDAFIHDIRTEKLRLLFNGTMGVYLIFILPQLEEFHFSITLLKAFLTLAVLIVLSLIWTRKFERNTSTIALERIIIPKKLKKDYLKLLAKWIPSAKRKELIALLNFNPINSSLDGIKRELELEVCQKGFYMALLVLLDANLFTEERIKSIYSSKIFYSVNSFSEKIFLTKESYKKTKSFLKEEKGKLISKEFATGWNSDLKQIILNHNL